VHDTYVPLVDDIHVASIARARSKVIVSPQTPTICYYTARKYPELQTNELYEISGTDNVFLDNEPGVLITNSLCTVWQQTDSNINCKHYK